MAYANRHTSPFQVGVLYGAFSALGLEPGLRAQRHRGVLSQQFRRTLYSATFVLLSGCAATSAPSELLPVASSCLPAQVPAMPLVRPDSELLALDDRQLVLTIASERLELIAWSRQIIPVLEACR